MLLRNINLPRLSNETRLVVKKKNHVKYIIKSTVVNGKFKGGHVLISQIPMILSDSPIQIKILLQFPICLTFAMNFNKAQGQSMQICGLDHEKACLSHGQ